MSSVAIQCNFALSNSARRYAYIGCPEAITNATEKQWQAAAFYDLEGTLVSTNLVHTLGFYARNQPGCSRSFKKSAATLLSLPVFAVTDQYSRKVFNDLFFKRYKGESEDRLRYFAQDLFENVLKPAVFPGALRADREVAQPGTAAGRGDRRAGCFGEAADGAPGHRRVCGQPAGVRERRRDRPTAAAGDGSGDQSFVDSHVTPNAKDQPERLVTPTPTA